MERPTGRSSRESRELALDELEGGQHALQVTQNPFAVKLDYCSRNVGPHGGGMLGGGVPTAKQSE